MTTTQRKTILKSNYICKHIANHPLLFMMLLPNPKTLVSLPMCLYDTQAVVKQQLLKLKTTDICSSKNMIKSKTSNDTKIQIIM